MADFQQEYGFFNYDEAVLESTGKYDREYTAEDFAKYFALFVGNGVFANPASQLMVKIAATKQTPYNVTVEPGWAFINGYWYHLQQKATLTIPVNTSAQTKYQRVVVRYNNTTREIGLTIAEAIGETIEPTRNDAIYDLALAQITVKSNASVLSASDVKDLRPSSKYCGYVAGAVNQIDAGTLYDNLTEQFNEWFVGVKDQLQQDEAIKLQNQIGNLGELNTEQKNNLVSAINSALSELVSHINTSATEEKAGHVKLSDSSDITDSTGLALPATEKNPSISGTMANQISKINTDTNAFKKYCPTFGTTYGQGIIFDITSVNTNNADGGENLIGYVVKGTTANLPTDCLVGIREVYYYNPNEVWVKITGPDTSNIMAEWFIRYNGSSWGSWTKNVWTNQNKESESLNVININASSGISNKVYNSGNWLVLASGNGITSRSKDNVNVYLPVSGSAFQQVSSKKVKENIKDLSEDEAKKILNVRAVSFDYIEKVGGEKNQRGVIAEEVEKLIPSCVYHDGDYPSVDYTKLIPYLIKIVQMQQKEIEELKKKVGENGEQ